MPFWEIACTFSVAFSQNAGQFPFLAAVPCMADPNLHLENVSLLGPPFSLFYAVFLRTTQEASIELNLRRTRSVVGHNFVPNEDTRCAIVLRVEEMK